MVNQGKEAIKKNADETMKVPKRSEKIPIKVDWYYINRGRLVLPIIMIIPINLNRDKVSVKLWRVWGWQGGTCPLVLKWLRQVPKHFKQNKIFSEKTSKLALFWFT